MGLKVGLSIRDKKRDLQVNMLEVSFSHTHLSSKTPHILIFSKLETNSDSFAISPSLTPLLKWRFQDGSELMEVVTKSNTD